MNLTDTAAYLTWLSQSDSRIQVTEPNVEIWGNALATIPTPTVKAVTLEHYRVNEQIAPTPAIIRKAGIAAAAREAAKHSALEAAPTVRNPNSYRASDPERWDAQVARGREQYRADLRARGITPHTDTCPDCSRPKTGAR